MVDSTKKPATSLPESGDGNLIQQIDKLEALLAEKKAQAQANQNILPKLNVGTDGIPVLVNAVTKAGLTPKKTSLNTPQKDDQFINDIDKINKEITEDLDELILMLKDSIIDEVKTISMATTINKNNK